MTSNYSPSKRETLPKMGLLHTWWHNLGIGFSIEQKTTKPVLKKSQSSKRQQEVGRWLSLSSQLLVVVIVLVQLSWGNHTVLLWSHLLEAICLQQKKEQRDEDSFGSQTMYIYIHSKVCSSSRALWTLNSKEANTRVT